MNVRQAEEQILVGEKTVKEAQENLVLAEGRYTAGVGNIIELTDAQVALTSARAQHVQAMYDYQTALAVGQRLRGE